MGPPQLHSAAWSVEYFPVPSLELLVVLSPSPSFFFLVEDDILWRSGSFGSLCPEHHQKQTSSFLKSKCWPKMKRSRTCLNLVELDTTTASPKRTCSLPNLASSGSSSSFYINNTTAAALRQNRQDTLPFFHQYTAPSMCQGAGGIRMLFRCLCSAQQRCRRSCARLLCLLRQSWMACTWVGSTDVNVNVCVPLFFAN